MTAVNEAAYAVETEDSLSSASSKATRGSKGFGADLKAWTAFFFVGMACGWFPVDAVLNLTVNEAPFGPAWLGKVLLIGGIVGLADGVLCFLYLYMFPDRQPLHREQLFVGFQSVVCIISLLLLAGFWSVGAPDYPFVLLATVLGNLIINCTYYISFPMISTFYGGWLVAPVRSGTDFSVMFTALLGEAQNPSGTENLFPSSVLFLIYTLLPVVGLVAWLMIVRFEIGLRSNDTSLAAKEDAERGHARDVEVAPSDNPRTVDPRGLSKALSDQFGGLACPRSLLGPVLIGSFADFFQWGVLASFSLIGAQMSDPTGCTGATGAFVGRTSYTVNRVLVTSGSLISTLLPCSRNVFYSLSVVQVTALVLVLLATGGVGREAWSTSAGQTIYIVCNGIVGGLEGYLLTMAFRLIGDDDSVPLKFRRSASGLLGFLNVVLVCVGQIVSGQLASSQTVSCQAL
eukprot:TRINITY_DN3783_c0_g1_i1.p1 TRINITY_DN3783_c0_g1~~TRINITY_DN3783_c0_g1_i1.p1  ORF type:complete len:458 (+),score=59.59 TRINITY_DN3783_c0_g1_i1:56-1429(+)